MKKNLLRRIGAVALAVAVSLTMGVTCFAADSVNTDGTWDQTSHGIETDANTINIAKEIVFVNDENTSVREPNIVYTYTISSVDPDGATVTDSTGMPGTVKAGPIDAVSSTTATATFADTNTPVSATSAGAVAKKYASFTFDPAKFAVSNVLTAGIYRYKITESCEDTTKAQVGITESDNDYDADRFLDVYVKWNDAHDKLVIYGYVLFKGTADLFIASDNVTMKSEGYVNTADSGQADVDVYETHNLTITKKIAGAMADTEHSFPITLAFADVTATPKVDVVVSNGGAIDGTTTEGDTSYIKLSTSIIGSVKNESTIDLKGIPAGTTVSLEEENNTTDSYKVKAGTAADTADLLPEAIIAPNGKAGPTTAQTLSEKRSIYITNTLGAISPTNVVMRFAPFLFIFGAAILLLVVMRRRRTHDAE